jgi:hypothetical protein
MGMANGLLKDPPFGCGLIRKNPFMSIWPL